LGKRAMNQERLGGKRRPLGDLLHSAQYCRRKRLPATREGADFRHRPVNNDRRVRGPQPRAGRASRNRLLHRCRPDDLEAERNRKDDDGKAAQSRRYANDCQPSACCGIITIWFRFSPIALY